MTDRKGGCVDMLKNVNKGWKQLDKELLLRLGGAGRDLNFGAVRSVCNLQDRSAGVQLELQVSFC